MNRDGRWNPDNLGVGVAIFALALTACEGSYSRSGCGDVVTTRDTISGKLVRAVEDGWEVQKPVTSTGSSFMELVLMDETEAIFIPSERIRKVVFFKESLPMCEENEPADSAEGDES